jgi:hypothetical protein
MVEWRGSIHFRLRDMCTARCINAYEWPGITTVHNILENYNRTIKAENTL